MQKQSTEQDSQTTKLMETLQNSKLPTYQILNCWLEDSRVKRFLLQEREEGLMTPEELSFLKLHGFAETKDPHIYYSKTLKVYYLTTREKLSREFLKFSPVWGIMLAGRYLTVKTMEYPKIEKGYLLKDILEKDVPTKYYISEERKKNLLANK